MSLHYEDEQIRIHKLSIGSLDNNVYVVTSPATAESIIIDATGEADRILEAAAGTTVQRILMTHGDRDHVGALAELKSRLAVPIAIHPADASMLPIPPDLELNDGETIPLGNLSFRVLHTPGHTAGSVCFLTGKHLFSGDTLFPGGPGNTQRAGGDFPLIIEGIRSKLFTLPDDTAVYPGHGKDTTIGAEKPHLEEWIKRGW